MKKTKQIIAYYIITCMISLCACGESVQGNIDWIPSEEISEENTQTEEIKVEHSEENKTEAETERDRYEIKVHSLESLKQAMLADNLDEFADMIWDNQRAAGLYKPELNEQNGKNVLTYYISSTEGNDNNDGLSPETPKKSIKTLSGVSNIHIYLKTDDVFAMDSSFSVGENVLLAAYGNGDRPILDYYQDFIGAWKRVVGYSNVWQLDLKEEQDIFKKLNSVEDCNIGHLLIDGECNWKRKEKQEGDVFNYAKYLADTQDNSWAVDWEQGLLYLYSEKNPNNQEISYAYPGFALSIGNVKNVCIAGVEITGVGMHGISLSNVTDVKIMNCYLHHIGGAILKRTNIRYGNAIELWDSGENLEITYNVAEWIYDTCYTTQGSAASAVQKNISFCSNLGSHSFAGLEIWGDGYSETPFENIRYNDNIMLKACDVTDSDVFFHTNKDGQLVEAEEYKGYRSGSYPYHQMALLNTGTNRNKESLQIQGNVFWGSNRFLALFLKSSVGNGYPELQDNLFVEEEYINGECVYRYSDANGTIYYLTELPKEVKNGQVVCSFTEMFSSNEMEGILSEKIDKMANGME